MKFIIKVDNSVDNSLGYHSKIVGEFQFEAESIESAEKVFEEFCLRFPNCAYQWFYVDATVPNFLRLKSFSGK